MSYSIHTTANFEKEAKRLISYENRKGKEKVVVLVCYATCEKQYISKLNQYDIRNFVK